MPLEPLSQLLGNPDLFESPADIGPHSHLRQNPVNRFDPIDHIANPFFGSPLGRSDTLHFIIAKTSFPTPLCILSRVLGRLVASTLCNRHPLPQPPAK